MASLASLDQIQMETIVKGREVARIARNEY